MRHSSSIALTTFIFAAIFSSAAEATDCKKCLPKLTGDAVHRNSTPSGMWVGHAGIAAGKLISNIIPGRDDDYRALAMSHWEDYVVDEGLFWGAKRHKSLPGGLTVDHIKALKKEIESKLAAKIKYDGNHLDQKGGEFTERDGTKYFEYDCVGWVEHLYERIIGFNLTPDSFESGAGWPLTVREQSQSENAVDVPQG